MKKKFFFVLCLLSNLLFATSIHYFYYVAYYKIENESDRHRWYITDNGINEFSGQFFGSLEYNTQMYLDQQSVMIGSDEGDSAIAFIYDYRYYKKNEPPSNWKHVDILFSNYANPYPGAYYTSWYIYKFPFFELPLDTGHYVLELAISSTVVGVAGDTLSKCYACPDGQELKGYFDVVAPLEVSTALELGEFKAEEMGNGLKLSWTTLSESECSHFILKRNGEKLTRINASGNSSEIRTYEHMDTHLPPGVYHYTLYSIDFGGSVNLLDSLSIHQKSSTEMTIHPNPFNACTKITLYCPVTDKYKISIYNIQGEHIKTVYQGCLETGNHEFIWNAEKCASGIYIVKMLNQNTTTDQKIVLIK